MRSSTGRWVDGNDFFDRESDLAILRARIEDRNHVVLSGQRRMGKTSLLQELARRLSDGGWLVLFVDVEASTSAEDVIAEIAQAAYEHRPLSYRLTEGVRHWFDANVEELDVHNFRVKFRSHLDGASWRRHGDRLLRECTATEKPVLLIIDELPIFLKKLLKIDSNGKRIEEFLSWLRSATQVLGKESPTIVLSGSIGLEPLVRRLGISDRINYLDPIRLGPWDRTTCVTCIEALAASHELSIEDGVGNAIYDLLGIGIPHHVQSFFARMRDQCIVQGRHELKVADAFEVYQRSLLGAPGQNDLMHYESRLQDALDDDGFSIAMEILAEAALEGSFTVDARRALAFHYQALSDGVETRTSEVLDVLVHDGYLAAENGDYRFASNLLKDWWMTRFRDHHVALKDRKTTPQE